jgi:hypothetical protein
MRISLALATVLAVAAGCQTSPELSAAEQSVEQDCLPDAIYCEADGQPLPTRKLWYGGALPFLNPGSLAIIEPSGQGDYTAYGVDLALGEVRWVRAIPKHDLGLFADQMDLAVLGMWLRPPPPPPPGQEALYLLEEGWRVMQAVENGRESAMVCGQFQEPAIPK